MTNTTDLGRWNAEAVLDCLYDREARTNTELASASGLSRSTVERALDLLVSLGVVGGSEPVALASGRPAVLYRLQPAFGHLLAIDVGANTVRARVDDLAGPRPGLDAGSAEPEPIRVDPFDPMPVRLEAVARASEAALAGAGIGRDRVRAVAVAVPGIVGADGRIARSAVIRSRDWDGDGLRTWLADRFPSTQVSIDNDANLAVLAEQRFGVAGNTEDVVVVLAGRRVGFGIIHGGRLHRGAHHQAGEAANIRDSWWGRASSWLYGRQAEAAQLFAAADAGDPAAAEDVAEFVDLLGMAFAEIVHTIDPELIVLGGALSLAGPAIHRPLANRFKLACHGMFEPELRLSTLGRRAVLLGAAERARRQAFDHMLDDARPQLPNATPRRRS
ncbi:ROK family transcriptional regulator [Streptomyces odontomachi]|uniref:ROK family transcriptional regulator n=1 Tax=Streptomyces odontomachi TaxID=2944940 RepID=UPI00210CB41D|nr:ROK family transcriptional regulator [Streptomyces sp. ODS25]